MIAVEYTAYQRRLMQKGYQPCDLCGKLVQHASGRCLACRKSKCKRAGCEKMATRGGLCTYCRRAIRTLQKSGGVLW